MPKISGGKAHTDRLKRLASPETRQQVGAALYAGGQLIEVHAARLITEGAVSGKGHVASAPGEAPNADTHVLDRNIETVQVEVDRVEVSSNAPYAAALEFGTSKVKERPYMRPAVAEKRGEVVDLIRRAVKRIAEGGRVT